MSDLLSQSDLLNDVVQVMHDEAGAYDLVSLTFAYDPDEGSVETVLAVVREGQRATKHLSMDGQGRIMDAGIALFDAMHAQTGGAWRSFQVDYPRGGQAKVGFTYD